jgi:hypothetical protein
LSIHGEFGRLDSILPTSVAEEVEVAAAVASGKVNGKHSATSSASAGYGLVGMRYGFVRSAAPPPSSKPASAWPTSRAPWMRSFADRP